MITLKEDITERLHAMSFLLEGIASLNASGIVSDERAFEICNCYLDHIDNVMKLAENEFIENFNNGDL
ncbi:MAG: hypothetical protein PHF86_03100 [Candidatus Nanoarchaeia archaeon]|jgi:hypothetical protein|nr:hypothetical protein [Candidatus Nanoarchaeia archaeon]